MLTYFKNNIIAAYITDKDGVAIEVDALDAAGVSLLNGEVPSPPVITSPIPDVSLTVGDPDRVIDLSEHFSGATSYTATVGAVTGSTLTIPTANEAATDVTVTATNSAGSVSDTFNLSIAAASVTSVVLVGASIIEAAFGRNLTTPSPEITALMDDPNVKVYGYGFGGQRMGAMDNHYSEIRAAHPDAYIIMHAGGNDVSATRPFETADNTALQDGMAQVFSVAGSDQKFYPASITFRQYDGNTFQADPDKGSRPYNENIIIPWIAENWPHALASYGRPKIDLYRHILSEFESYLGGDGVHMSQSGIVKFRDLMADLITQILEGQTPEEVEERLFEDPVVDPEPATYTAHINFYGNAANNVTGNGVLVDDLNFPPLELIDTTGDATGLTLNSSAFDPNDATIPFGTSGLGLTTSTVKTGAVAYDGTSIKALEVLNESVYFGGTIELNINITGALPDSEYRFTFVGTRTASDQRSTTVTDGTNSAVWPAGANPPVEASLDVLADSSGSIDLVIKSSKATGDTARDYAYLAGMSISPI